MSFKVEVVPILQDNFSYIIIDSNTKKTAVVDPAEPQKVMASFKQLQLSPPSMILTTHKHWDHSGGNEVLSQNYQGIEVIGSAIDAVPACTKAVKDGDCIDLGETKIQVLFTPCHTKGHLMYLCRNNKNSIDEQKDALFTGDTIFISGCGKFFEGDAQDMLAAMSKVSDLDPSTLIYCGHEYTISNMKFAFTIEKDNEDLRKKYEEAQGKISKGEWTVPSSIGIELKCNPFMRTHLPSVKKALGFGEDSDPVKVLAEMRRRKNDYKASNI